MRKIFTAVCLLAVLCLAGCIQSQRPQPVAVEVQYLETTVIEGQTTKTEILKVFGHPDDFSPNSLDYSYQGRPLEAAKIRYVQKDGTEFMVILRRNTDKKSVTFWFKEDGTLREAQWH